MKKIYFLFTLLISAASFGQVFITELADPNDNPDARYIELYNAGVSAVDLNNWRIDKYTNASATVSQTLTLTGTIPAGGFYIIATGPMDTAVFDAWGVTPDQWDPGANDVAGSNGDDNLELYNASNTLIDQFGVPGEDGTGTCHEFEDGRAERVASVTSGNPTWDESEWNVWADSAAAGPCTNHTSTLQNVADSFDPGAWIGTATGPTISVSGAISGLDYFEGNGPSNEDNFTVGGINLTTNITVTAPTNFEVSLTSGSGFGPSVIVTQSGGTAPNTTVYVRLAAGLTANAYNGDVTASSTGATSEIVSLSGTVSPAVPQVTVNGSLGSLDYILGNGPSNEDTFSVEGLFLTSNITVTAPTNFEVSLTSGSGFSSSVSVTQSGGTVNSTTIYVRMASGLTVASYSGDITVSATGVADQTVAASGNVFGAATNSLVLTGIVDGPLTGGVPKAIELYVVNDIADLSLFGISSITNGAGSSAGNIEYTFPADAVTAGTFIYLATEAVGFNDFFGFAPTYTNGVVGVNGDDSIELYENGQIIDTFGDVTMDGSGLGWDYLDGWAYRNDDTGPDGTFVESNWYYSGVDALDGETLNSTAVTPFPIGTYMRALSVSQFENNTFKVYPNPTSTGFVTITSSTANDMNVSVFDILGKQVINETVANNRLNVSTLNSGVYIMKISQNGATATKKLVIK